MEYYRKAKVYFDGSHYIAIPYSTRPQKRKSASPNNKSTTVVKVSVDDINQKTVNKKTAQTEIDITFERLYKENLGKKRKERTESVTEGMLPLFKNESQAIEYVAKHIERKQRNLITRRVRLWRKVNLQDWTYFATFTYDDTKWQESAFRKSLSNCLKHLSSRKGWKYIGVWERSPEKQRLHFHCLLYIPKGAEVGVLIQKNDYDTVSHRRQVTYQNSYFNDRYGRTDFKEINRQDIGKAVGYIAKYMEKTGERIVYSKGLPRYFQTDLMGKDVVCYYGVDDRKLLLFDNFSCWDDGEYLGIVSPEVIAKRPKIN